MHTAERAAAGVVALAGAAPSPVFAVLAQDGVLGTVLDFGAVLDFEGVPQDGGWASGDDECVSDYACVAPGDDGEDEVRGRTGGADDSEELRCILEEVIPARIVGNCARAVVLVLPSDALRIREDELDDEGSNVELVHLLGVDAGGRVLARSGRIERDSDHMAVTCDFSSSSYSGPELRKAQAAWLAAMDWTLRNRGPN